MGLEIWIYTGLKPEENPVFDEYGETEDCFLPVRICDLNRCEDLKDSYYTFSDREPFFSMTYGSYNEWREELARLAGYPKTLIEDKYRGSRELHAATCWEGAEGPFSELINFSDCDGTIGPNVCKKLAEDFEQFNLNLTNDDYFKQNFIKMKNAFREAADNYGCLHFA